MLLSPLLQVRWVWARICGDAQDLPMPGLPYAWPPVRPTQPSWGA